MSKNKKHKSHDDIEDDELLRCRFPVASKMEPRVTKLYHNDHVIADEMYISIHEGQTKNIFVNGYKVCGPIIGPATIYIE
jgi:hypothetical protein